MLEKETKNKKEILGAFWVVKKKKKLNVEHLHPHFSCIYVKIALQNPKGVISCSSTFIAACKSVC